jgi:nitroimidazol reductase NimA-like FMN-containing flavoprotein (pyridoxamine 5'-phosphate oxidase superfamily)
MARIPAELGLTADELDELMSTSWNMRVATIGPGDRINVTPLWFGWAAGRVYFFGRGQKIANLRRSPVCAVLVDRNERYTKLEGAMFQGHATVLENAEQEDADPHLSKRCAGRWERNILGDMAKRRASSVFGIRIRRAAGRRGGSSLSPAG